MSNSQIKCVLNCAVVVIDFFSLMGNKVFRNLNKIVYLDYIYKWNGTVHTPIIMVGGVLALNIHTVPNNMNTGIKLSLDK